MTSAPTISNWKKIRNIIRGVPCIALTATATDNVVKEIKSSLHFTKSSLTFSVSCFRWRISHILDTDNDDDWFGGGRRGAKRESEAYASEIEEPDWSVRQKQEKEEKRARQSLIADEFKKRRGNRPSTSMAGEEMIDPDCPLREIQCKRIPSLTVKMRDHCYGLIREALVSNCTKCTADFNLSESEFKPRIQAIDAEYGVFSSVKTAHAYKLNTHKKDN